MNFGIRAHDLGLFTSDTMENLFIAAQSYGFTHLQFAPWKSFSDIDDDGKNFTPKLAHKLAGLCKDYDINIAVLGAYFNMIDPNLHTRQLGIERFIRMMELSMEAGYNLVASETGSYQADCTFDSRNHNRAAYDTACHTIEQLLRHAETSQCTVGIEAVYTLSIWNTDLVQQLIQQFQSPYLKIIFDLVNLLPPQHSDTQAQILKQAFAIFGNHIAYVHMKDCTIGQGEKHPARIGTGIIDYSALLQAMQPLQLHGILEELPQSDMQSSLDYLQGIAS